MTEGAGCFVVGKDVSMLTGRLLLGWTMLFGFKVGWSGMRLGNGACPFGARLESNLGTVVGKRGVGRVGKAKGASASSCLSMKTGPGKGESIFPGLGGWVGFELLGTPGMRVLDTGDDEASSIVVCGRMDGIIAWVVGVRDGAFAGTCVSSSLDAVLPSTGANVERKLDGADGPNVAGICGSSIPPSSGYSRSTLVCSFLYAS
jgi:hypothetical protein